MSRPRPLRHPEGGATSLYGHRRRSLTPERQRFARRMRRNPTPSEARVWGWLKTRPIGGFRWKRQEPMWNFIADFWCPKLKLVLEVDGSRHHDLRVAAADRHRKVVLESHGISVVSVGDLVSQETLLRVLLRAADKHTRQGFSAGQPQPGASPVG